MKTTIAELLKALKSACEEMGMDDTEWWDDAQTAIAKAEIFMAQKEEDTIEERLHKALWAISGSDYLVPRVEKALRVALKMAYESGKAIRDEVLTNSSNDCVEAFIEELKK